MAEAIVNKYIYIHIIIGGLLHCMLSDGLDNNSLSDNEDRGVSFRICENLKMTPYSQINPISHLKLTCNYK